MNDLRALLLGIAVLTGCTSETPLDSQTSEVGGTLIPSGRLAHHDHDRAARWHTNTWGRVITNLTVQNDCNVVLYQNGAAIWHTQTYGCVSRL